MAWQASSQLATLLERIWTTAALAVRLLPQGVLAPMSYFCPIMIYVLRCADTADSHSNIESVLDSDMTTKGATLTQNELNAQGGNSVVAILTKILDEPDLELRTETAEGLCKLLMIGAISSPKLLSRLLLIWYNPMTEPSCKLRHILGTFFPLYCSMSRANQVIPFRCENQFSIF